MSILYLIGFLKSTSSKGIKFYADIKLSPIYKMLKENNFQITEETVLTFTDLSWDDCIDTREAEYISAAVACMKASHIKMLEYD